MSRRPVIVWFRRDLRLADNPALAAALESALPVVPLYIDDRESPGAASVGAASGWWLHQSLLSLGLDLASVGLPLLLRKGSPLTVLRELISETDAAAVHWNRRYEPAAIQRDSALKSALQSMGVEARSHNSALLHEPWTIANKSRKPFRVFTPFWRHCSALPVTAPLARPEKLPRPRTSPTSLTLDELRLEPVPDWAGGIRAAWQPGEAGAQTQLDRFLTDAFSTYDTGRDRPDQLGTSRLSPHLHFGEISPRQIWHQLAHHAKCKHLSVAEWRGSQFLAELGWREFAHHLLYHFPQTVTEPLRPEFAAFPWHHHPEGLQAWQQGRTGYPIVDAGMRQLWSTGWMHNRVRMVAASFLVKDLLIHWREGAKWFMDTLVDADLAANTLGWQWTAGCGADAAPFFRIFNPTSQGERFDPDGDYVRRWVPELAKLPARWIHQPWNAPDKALHAAGIKLSHHYPEPIVSHTIARNVALEAYQRIRRKS